MSACICFSRSMNFEHPTLQQFIRFHVTVSWRLPWIRVRHPNRDAGWPGESVTFFVRTSTIRIRFAGVRQAVFSGATAAMVSSITSIWPWSKRMVSFGIEDPSPQPSPMGEREEELDSRWIPDYKRRGQACGNDGRENFVTDCYMTGA